VVIVEAREELFVFTVEVIVSTLPANDAEKVLEVVLTEVIEDAREALFVFIALDKPLMDSAAEELLVVTVLLIFVIVELKEPDVL
jgi:hypothetical protein